MKIIKYLIVFLFVSLLVNPFLSGQISMSEFDGIKVNLEIRSGGKKINEGPVYLLKRGVSKSDYLGQSAYGYESYVLEFKTRIPIKTNRLKRKRVNEYYYTFKCYNPNDELIETLTLDKWYVIEFLKNKTETEQRNFYYMLDLSQFPLLLFESVKAIDIEYFEKNLR